MQKLFIGLLLLSVFSCKKKTDNNTGFPFGGTNWNLHFKNNPTFSFFAESELYFDSDTSVQNYRNVDTVSGSWKSTPTTVTIDFYNGDVYNGTVITNDSISGTLSASGNSGVWYATRR